MNPVNTLLSGQVNAKPEVLADALLDSLQQYRVLFDCPSTDHRLVA
jgi:hypothetical protein